MQDKEDDLQIGVKSTALLFGEKTKYWLWLFNVGMVTNLILAGLAADQTWLYYTGIGVTAAHLTWQVKVSIAPFHYDVMVCLHK